MPENIQEELFSLQVNQTGGAWIKKNFTICRWLFGISVFMAIILIIQFAAYFYLRNAVQLPASQRQGFFFTYQFILYPIIGCVDAVLVIFQYSKLKNFTNGMHAAKEGTDERLFNDSFRHLFSFILLGILQFGLLILSYSVNMLYSLKFILHWK